MLWNTSILPAGSPFVALRKDFEHQLGLKTSPAFAAMTVTELGDHWRVSVDVPGLVESDIEVTFSDNSLIIEGERKPQCPEGAREVYSDRAFSKFRRVLKVREAIDQSRIDASLTDGVLTLVLYRAAEPATNKITIRGAKA
jgi:HSP20 family protein